MSGGCVGSDASFPGAPAREQSAPATTQPEQVWPDAAVTEVLRRLFALPPETARRVREEIPRRRSRRPQRGPGLDLGSAD